MFDSCINSWVTVSCFTGWINNNAGLVVALLAMCATFWQGWIARRHNQLSVQPFLQTTTCWHKIGEHFTVSISNNGFGPAVISSYKMDIDGTRLTKENYVKTLSPLFSASFTKATANQMQLNFQEINGKSVISASEKKLLLRVSIPEEKLLFDEIVDSPSKLSIEINYSSLYGKKYTLIDSIELHTSNLG